MMPVARAAYSLEHPGTPLGLGRPPAGLADCHLDPWSPCRPFQGGVPAVLIRELPDSAAIPEMVAGSNPLLREERGHHLKPRASEQAAALNNRESARSACRAPLGYFPRGSLQRTGQDPALRVCAR